MKISQKKLNRQLEIIAKWKGAGCKGTVEACTGFGKTYIGILIIQQLHKKYPNAKIDVVVPKIDLLDDWIHYEHGHIRLHGLHNVEVFVVNSYIKLPPRNIDLLILDEGHRYASEEFSKVFEVAQVEPVCVSVGKTPFCLLLTATLERLDGKHDFLKEFAPIVDSVTLDEAKKEGYISEFKTYNWGVDFTEEEQEEYNRVHSIFNNAFAKFEHNFDLAMACSRGDGAIAFIRGEGKLVRDWKRNFALSQGWDGADMSDLWSPKSITVYAQQFSSAMRQRKTLIYRAANKFKAVEELVNKFPVKTLVFNEDSWSADKLEEILGEERCKSYHSGIKGTVITKREEIQLKTKLKVVYKKVRIGAEKWLKMIKDDFMVNDKFQVLSTVRKLDEGFDFEKVGMGIQASYSSSKTQNTQRNGRAARLDLDNDDKLALIINLYVKGSQEEKWLQSKQKGTRNIVWVSSIDEINLDSEPTFDLA